MVLTASHVLEREEDLTVVAGDGRSLPARFVGRDPSSDLAVLAVEGLDVEPASPAEGEPRIGQLALAVGSPGRGEGPRASLGVVSSVGGPMRTWRGPRLERYIQTDATPYPGFSGGPLVDAGGNVLGIMTTGLARGAALAIPAELAWRVAKTHRGARIGQARLPRHPEPAGPAPRRAAAGADPEGRPAGRRASRKAAPPDGAGSS